MQRAPLYLIFCFLMLLLIRPIGAITGDDESWQPPPNDPDYAAGMAAFEHADWQGVIDNMARVIEQRPWRDNAYNLMGFAYRKLGDYSRAILHYQKALDLNPYHRGAMEYLGEAYVEMGCMAQAHEMLRRLEAACKRVMPAPSKDDWKSGCAAWQELKAAIETWRGPAKPDCAPN